MASSVHGTCLQRFFTTRCNLNEQIAEELGYKQPCKCRSTNIYCLLSLQSFCLVSILNGTSVPLQFDEQMQSLSQYDHIAFTSRNGIHAVMQRLEELQGSTQAALQALHDSKVQCWALGADAQLLKSYGVQSVQTPTEVSASADNDIVIGMQTWLFCLLAPESLLRCCCTG